jgi:drug/metabolite transporter (DMT)-like permease
MTPTPASHTRSIPDPAMRALLVLLFVIWANSFTAIKYLLETLDPMELVLARFLPVSVFCLLYLLLSPGRRRDTVSILRSAPLGVIAMGLTGVAGYNFFLYTGQGGVKPGAASLLTTLSPLFILVLAILFLKERVPTRRVLGIVLAFAGLYLVVRWGRVGLAGIASVEGAELRYVLVTALAPLSWSIYTIVGKSLLGRASPVVVTYLTLVIGTLPFLAFADADFFRTMAAFSWEQWAALAHLSVLCTIVGFLIWVAALSRLPATEVASYVYLNPPLAALFGHFLFGEEITGLFVLGSAVVLFGLWLAQGNRTGG